MFYKFLSTHTSWLPHEPNIDTFNEPNPDISEIVLPRLAAVGGPREFAKYLHDHDLLQAVTYSNESEKKMLDQLLNQLVADGFPKDVIEMFNVLQLDTFNSTLQQFAREEEDIQHRNANNWLPMEAEYKFKLRPTVSYSDLRQFGFDHLCSPKSKQTTGYIRWLPKLCRLEDGNGMVDIGTYIYFVAVLLLLY